MIEQKLKNYKKEILAKLEKAESRELVEKLEVEYLSRKGKFTLALKGIRAVKTADRPKVGQLVNELKQEINTAFSEAFNKFNKEKKVPESFDVTLPGRIPPFGHLHPLTQMLHKIWEVFSAMDYEIVEGPEIETDYYNFQALNMPAEHPARDMQDTFYLKGFKDLLLRTHTSSTCQPRAMKGRRAPLRIIATGKCFRRDEDISHTPMFHQFDGIAVDRGITFSNLKGTLHQAMRRILEQEVKVRFRMSYFPFVEPGAEFDVSCTICGGRGCPTCKKTGWIEMGGCGMIHPNVLKEVGYNPDKVSGFAFGFGVERPVMIKYKINDIRLFFDNDLRFLRQF